MGGHIIPLSKKGEENKLKREILADNKQKDNSFFFFIKQTFLCLLMIMTHIFKRINIF